MTPLHENSGFTGDAEHDPSSAWLHVRPPWHAEHCRAFFSALRAIVSHGPTSWPSWLVALQIQLLRASTGVPGLWEPLLGCPSMESSNCSHGDVLPGHVGLLLFLGGLDPPCRDEPASSGLIGEGGVLLEWRNDPGHSCVNDGWSDPQPWLWPRLSVAPASAAPS